MRMACTLFPPPPKLNSPLYAEERNASKSGRVTTRTTHIGHNLADLGSPPWTGVGVHLWPHRKKQPPGFLQTDQCSAAAALFFLVLSLFALFAAAVAGKQLESDNCSE